MKPIDDRGQELDAIYTVEGIPDGAYLILESRGGSTGGRPPRNVDYSAAFEVLLRRLGQLSATLIDIEVYSNITQKLPFEQRRLSTPTFPLPIDLSSLVDLEHFRHEIGRASAALGRQSDSKGGGNPTKKLRLTLRWPGAVGRTNEQLEHLLASKITTQSGLLVPSTVQGPTSDPVEFTNRVVQARHRIQGARQMPSPPIGNAEVAQSEISNRRYFRDPEVVAWVLIQANGICECCAHSAPFYDQSGEPFLEVHHVRPLAEGGPDQTENAVAVCPNCHRWLHYGADKEEGRLRLIERVERLRDYPRKDE
jgi:hypothetical protein